MCRLIRVFAGHASVIEVLSLICCGFFLEILRQYMLSWKSKNNLHIFGEKEELYLQL